MNFIIFAIRSLTVACCSAFVSKYDARFGSFFFSCQHQTGINAVFFVVNTVNIIHGMQVLNMFNYCMDTMGLFIIPFITYSYKIVKASIGGRIFTQGSPHTHPCRPSSCLNCHKPNNWNYCHKDLFGNCQKDVLFNWNISFSLSSPNFSVSRLHVYQLSLL